MWSSTCRAKSRIGRPRRNMGRRSLTSQRRRARLASRRSYARGGRAGNRQRLECNIPSHIIGERTAQNAELQTQDLLASSRTARGNVRLDRMLQGQQSASLNRRRAAALALGAATVAVATRALPRSRARPKFRVAKRAPRFPRVVGIPRTRTRTTAGSRRGMKGGAFRFPRITDFPRNRRLRRPSHTGPEGGFFQPGEEGF